METSAVHELTAAYALDALDEAEEREYEEHLAHCERCRAELAAFSEAAAALAHGSPPSPAPPPELRERIVQQARAERPNVVPLRRPRQIVPAAIAAVAACAAIGLGIWAASLSSSLDNERAARREQARVVSILAASGAQRLPLSNDVGSLVVAQTGEAALVVPTIDHAPAGKTYEAWVIEGGTPARAGLFRGGGPVAIRLERPVPNGALVAVTVERSGGVDAPTSTPIFTSKPA
jgi:anti-sigma factor RsiW